MKKKTQPNPSNYDNFHVNSIYYTPPLFTKHSKMNKTKCKSTSKETVVTCNASNPNKWGLGSLLHALPFTPSPVSSNGHHGSKSTSSSSSVHDCDFVSRASHEFYTPTHHLSSVLSSTSFRKQEQSPKRKSISTIYESTMDHQSYMVQENRQENISDTDTYSPKRLVPSETPYDHQLLTSTTEIDDRRFSYPLLPSGSKEKTRRWSENYVRKSLEVTRDEYIKAMKAQLQIGEEEKKEKVVVEEEEEEEHSAHIFRPIPYQDFLDEVQKHKRRVELDALYKAAYTKLLDKLKKKEADIDSWELSQRSKAEFKLDRIERKLEKKKAKATQKMHQKVAEAKMEAERRKYKERESVMKTVAKLCQKSQGYRPPSFSLFFPWSSRKSQYTPTATTPRAS